MRPESANPQPGVRLVPVFIEKTSPVTSFVEIFTRHVTFNELRLSVGSKWLPGGRFFVADSLQAIGEGEVVQLRPGIDPPFSSSEGLCGM